MTRSLFLLVFLTGIFCQAHSNIIHVSSDQSVQAAIDASAEGDTILVAQGTYFENINFLGKAITVASHFILDGDTSFISRTIIDGSQPANADTVSTVLMVSGEDSTSVLTGFTITGGNGTLLPDEAIDNLIIRGGGIYINMSGGKIEHNVIHGNHIDQEGHDARCYGGGLFGMVQDSLHLIIRSNTFRDNSITALETYGGGLCLGGGLIICEHNVIEDNLVSGQQWSEGGGLCWSVGHGEGIIQEAHIRSNLIIRNRQNSPNQNGAGGGLSLAWGFEEGFARVYNNIIRYNTSNNAGGGMLTLYFRGMIYNNTFLDNSAANEGNNMIIAFDGEVYIYNNIFWRRSISTRESVAFFYTEPSLCHVYQNLVREALPTIGNTGNGNIIGNPMFLGDSYQLKLFSPGIGQGIGTSTVNGTLLAAPERDFHGNPRPDPVDGRVDLGAVESPHAGYVHIPGPAFRSALADKGVVFFQEEYMLMNDAEAFKTLDVADMGISDMTGLQAFINLDSLICSGNTLEDLDLSAHAGLGYLDCSGNPLTQLDLSRMSSMYYLDLSQMPQLGGVCAWTFPFPPDGVFVDTSGSPLMAFTDECFRNQPPEVIASQFGIFNLETEEFYMPGRLFIPAKPVPGESYPLVITLHGAGEKGNDNQSQILYNHLATTWAAYEWQIDHPCFVFSPQCVYDNWNTEAAYQAVMVQLDSLIGMHPIDSDRIYITGLSLGGHGTWEYMARDPDLYAAAMPVCGGYWDDSDQGVNEKVGKIRHIPVWNFHGNKDDVVQTQLSRDIMKAYMEYGEYPVLTHQYFRKEHFYDPGADPAARDEKLEEELSASNWELLYSEVANVGHDVWNVAYQSPLAKEWLFRQRKHAADHIMVESLANGSLMKAAVDRIPVSESQEISFQASEQCDSISVWIGHEHSINWELVEMTDPAAGQYSFDSRKVGDHAFARLRFLAHDVDGHVIGKDYSDIMRINNEENGPPYVRILDDYFLQRSGINKAVHTMDLLVGDPEMDSVKLSLQVSYDKGETFETFDERTAPEGEEYLAGVLMSELYRSDETVLRIVASDGELSYDASTLYFNNLVGTVVSNEYLPEGSFSMYPNPVSGILTITTAKEGRYEVELRSLNGQLLLRDAFHGDVYEKDLSFFPAGTYFITLRSEEQVVTRKIIRL